MTGVLLAMAIGGTIAITMVALAIVQWREAELHVKYGFTDPSAKRRWMDR